MRATFRLLCLALLPALAGCGDLVPIAGPEPAATGGIAAVEEPRMIATFETRGAREPLALVSRRGAYEIWRNAGGTTITLREGVLNGTQALSPDLFSVEAAVPTDWRSLRRPALSERVHRYVDGNEDVIIRGYRCEISAAARDKIQMGDRSLATARTDESCGNATQSFTNSYWLDGSGRMVQSRQWIGPKIGYLRLNHFLP
ncbi:YjbF family lipoprotein [Tropicimonas sp. IMCC6043]|uniref:YjbF family lipoprotein n=1 Tax=Tropicimonas sp. IMCC6043 TaxID=2510645 RepID=UPI00101CDFDD|nr:YjbF family lipoprotein [Tropicimonas sp. IMCC6043]RYH10109.1 hypothetical protein EU800_09480 [Tropicimonas sp. IMCC6043]